jgi:apolipoprotein N-acyltransferase
MKALLAAAVSGILLYLSQGLNDMWFLAGFALVPILWLAYSNVPLWQLILASMSAWLVGQIYAFQCYGSVSPLLILSGLLPLTILFPLAVIFARFTQQRASGLATLFAYPACWTSLEFLYGFVAPNGSFGSLAYSQMSAPLVIQSASLLGMYSVTFLICLFANSLAMALRSLSRSGRLLTLGLGICALDLVFGFVRLSQPQPAAVTVSAFVDGSAMLAAYRSDTLDSALSVPTAYANAIRQAAAQGAQFAVTAEGGIVSRQEWRDTLLAPLSAVARQTGVQIVAGVYERVPPADLAFALQSDGTTRSYAKRHLVPFVETEFKPGHGSGWLGEGRAMAICKDMDFPRTILGDAKSGIRLMGVPAGDFGKDAWLHARMAIMRGVENGFAIVRAADEGLLTASDAEGRVIAQKSAASPGMTVLIADLPLGPGPTLYTRIGDTFPYCLIVLCLGLGAVIVRRRLTLGGLSIQYAFRSFVESDGSKQASRNFPDTRSTRPWPVSPRAPQERWPFHSTWRLRMPSML